MAPIEQASEAAQLRILVYGYGNPGRRDDGLGPRFAEAVEAWADLEGLTHISCETAYQLNIEDAETIGHFDVVVFADASQEPGIEEYAITRLESDPARIEFSMHAVSPGFVLKLCEDLYSEAPEAWLVHIRGESWDFGEGLSQRAQHNLLRALKGLEGEVQELEALRRRALPSSQTRFNIDSRRCRSRRRLFFREAAVPALLTRPQFYEVGACRQVLYVELERVASAGEIARAHGAAGQIIHRIGQGLIGDGHFTVHGQVDAGARYRVGVGVAELFGSRPRRGVGTLMTSTALKGVATIGSARDAAGATHAPFPGRAGSSTEKGTGSCQFQNL